MDWVEYNITYLAEILNHQRVPLSSMQRVNKKGIYPYYGASGVIDYIDEFIFDGEYLLISEDGENLKTRQTPIAFIAKGQFWVNNHAHIIKGKYPHTNKLLAYYFANIDIKPYLSGSVQPKLNKASLCSIPINLPSDIDEQKRIADVLSALDDKIEINNKINENLEAQAQAIFKQWFVDFEFPDKEGKPYKSNGGKFIDSELGEIPEGWRLGSIGDYCKVRSGFAFKSSWWLDDNFKEDKVKVIKIKCIDNSQINLNDCSFVSSDKCELAREFLVNEGDLVIAMTGATLGKFAIIPKLDEKLLVNQRVGKFFLGVKPIEKMPFLHLTLKQDRVYNEIVNKGQGSAQPNISSSDIENVEIVFPNEEILCDFNSKMNYLYQLLSNNKNENQKLSEIRDGLLPRLMSGEVRV